MTVLFVVLRFATQAEVSQKQFKIEIFCFRACASQPLKSPTAQNDKERDISVSYRNLNMTKTGQPQYDNVSVSRDISFASLTQYDNVGLSLRASETSVAISSFPVIASKSQDLRGKTRQSRSFFSNLSKIASDLQNVQLAIKWDCEQMLAHLLAMTALSHLS